MSDWFQWLSAVRNRHVRKKSLKTLNCHAMRRATFFSRNANLIYPPHSLYLRPRKALFIPREEKEKRPDSILLQTPEIKEDLSLTIAHPLLISSKCIEESANFSLAISREIANFFFLSFQISAKQERRRREKKYLLLRSSRAENNFGVFTTLA